MTRHELMALLTRRELIAFLEESVNTEEERLAENKRKDELDRINLDSDIVRINKIKSKNSVTEEE